MTREEITAMRDKSWTDAAAYERRGRLNGWDRDGQFLAAQWTMNLLLCEILLRIPERP